MPFPLPVAPLFVPASRPDRFHKAAASGADAIILDLEDGVSPADKDAARAAIMAYADKAVLPVIVRVNGQGMPWHEADLAALARMKITAVMLPKAESAADIAAIGDRVGHDVPVIPLVETAKGLSRLSQITETPNVAMLAFGSIDFALDLGCSEDWQTLLAVRSEIVWRSRAANLPQPLDGVTVDLDDPDVIERDACHAAGLGFGGKMAVHPKQIAPIKQAFRPSEAAVAWAQRVLAATASGEAVRVDGAMVDRPVIERAHRILSRRACSATDPV